MASGPKEATGRQQGPANLLIHTRDLTQNRTFAKNLQMTTTLVSGRPQVGSLVSNDVWNDI